MLQPITLSLTSLPSPARTGGSPMATTSDFALALADLAGGASTVAVPGAAVAAPAGVPSVAVAVTADVPTPSALQAPPALPDLAATGKALPRDPAMRVIDMPATPVVPPLPVPPQPQGLVTTKLTPTATATPQWTASVTTPAAIAAGNGAMPIAATVDPAGPTPAPVTVGATTLPPLAVVAGPLPDKIVEPETPRPIAVSIDLPSPKVASVVAPLAAVPPVQSAETDDGPAIVAAPVATPPITAEAPPKVDGRRTRYVLDAPIAVATPAPIEADAPAAETSSESVDSDPPTQQRVDSGPAMPDPYLPPPVIVLPTQPAPPLAADTARVSAPDVVKSFVLSPVAPSQDGARPPEPFAAFAISPPAAPEDDSVVPSPQAALAAPASVTLPMPTEPFADRSPANLDTVRAIVRPSVVAPDTAVAQMPVQSAAPAGDPAAPQPPLTTPVMPAARSLRDVPPAMIAPLQTAVAADTVVPSPEAATRPVSVRNSVDMIPSPLPHVAAPVTRAEVKPAAIIPADAPILAAALRALDAAPAVVPDGTPTLVRPVPVGGSTVAVSATAPAAAPAVQPTTPAPRPVASSAAPATGAATTAALPVDIAVEAARPVARADVTTVALPVAVAPPPRAEVLPAAQMFAQAMFAVPVSPADADGAGGDALPLSFVSGFGHVGAQPTPIAVPGATAADGKTLDMSRGEWMTSMIDTIETLRDESGAIGETRLKLSPDALGNLDVTVRRDDAGQYQVRIATDTAQARTILTDAAPRLHDMAEARGLKLSHAGVDTGAGTNPGFADSNRRDAQQTAATPRRPASAANDAAAASDSLQSDTRLA